MFTGLLASEILHATTSNAAVAAARSRPEHRASILSNQHLDEATWRDLYRSAPAEQIARYLQRTTLTPERARWAIRSATGATLYQLLNQDALVAEQDSLTSETVLEQARLNRNIETRLARLIDPDRLANLDSDELPLQLRLVRLYSPLVDPAEIVPTLCDVTTPDTDDPRRGTSAAILPPSADIDQIIGTHPEAIRTLAAAFCDGVLVCEAVNVSIQNSLCLGLLSVAEQRRYFGLDQPDGSSLNWFGGHIAPGLHPEVAEELADALPAGLEKAGLERWRDDRMTTLRDTPLSDPRTASVDEIDWMMRWRMADGWLGLLLSNPNLTATQADELVEGGQTKTNKALLTKMFTRYADRFDRHDQVAEMLRPTSRHRVGLASDRREFMPKVTVLQAAQTTKPATLAAWADDQFGTSPDLYGTFLDLCHHMADSEEIDSQTLDDLAGMVHALTDQTDRVPAQPPAAVLQPQA